jgi:hypothetical protein
MTKALLVTAALLTSCLTATSAKADWYYCDANTLCWDSAVYGNDNGLSYQDPPSDVSPYMWPFQDPTNGLAVGVGQGLAMGTMPWAAAGKYLFWPEVAE